MAPPAMLERVALSPSSDVEVLELGLEQRLTIEGAVLLGESVVGVAGVDVVALPESERWDAAALQRGLSHSDGVARSTTDAQGRFTLEVESPQAPYSLAAGGVGIVCKSAVRGVRAGELSAIVRVEHAFALWVRIREAGGGMPRVPRELYGSRYGTARPERGAPHTSLSGAAQLALALGGEPLTDSSPFDRLYVFASPAPEPEIGPVRLELDWPGYEREEQSFMVPRSEGPIEELFVELRPTSECRGSANARWRGLPSDLPAGDAFEPLALVHVDGEPTGPFDVAVWSFSSARAALGELPCGAYRVWLTRGTLPVRGVPEGEAVELSVDDSGGECELDLARQGWALLDFVQPDGSAYSGKASIVCGPGSVHDGFGGAESRLFTGPPYLFGPLEPGIHHAYLSSPRFGDRSTASARAAAVELVIAPSTVTRATCALPGPP